MEYEDEQLVEEQLVEEPLEGEEDDFEDIDEEGDIAADYLEELLDIVDMDGDIDIEVRNNRIYLSVVNDDDDNEELRRQVGYSDSPEAVSTDFVGSRTAGVVDSLATVVTDDSAIVYVWYDNEFGYSCQVIRVLERMGGYEVPSYPAK